MYLLCDIGGSNMRIDVSRPEGLSIQPQVIPTPQNFEKGIELIKDTVTEIGEGNKIKGIAIGIAGSLNKDKTQLEASPHLENWINKPLKETLEYFFKVPVLLENDTALVGLGEAVAGAGKNKKIVAYLTISTGFGGARIVNENIDVHSLGFEPGHQIISISGKPFEETPITTTLEEIVSGTALAKRFGQNSELIKDPYIWEEVNRWVAFGVLNTILYWSPDIVVIGGSVTDNLSTEKIHRFVRENLNIFKEIPPIVKAELGKSGGLYGGFVLLQRNFSAE